MTVTWFRNELDVTIQLGTNSSSDKSSDDEVQLLQGGRLVVVDAPQELQEDIPRLPKVELVNVGIVSHDGKLSVDAKLHEANTAEERRTDVASEILERTLVWAFKSLLINERWCFPENEPRLEQLVTRFVVDLTIDKENVP
jgi:hypothetical protein